MKSVKNKKYIKYTLYTQYIMSEYTTLRVRKETRDLLAQLGRTGEKFDTVLHRAVTTLLKAESPTKEIEQEVLQEISKKKFYTLGELGWK